ncbi:MAG: glk [Xanthomonadaceae bacterium]|nr:glk [Xanthomonadaceae bacterium]
MTTLVQHALLGDIGGTNARFALALVGPVATLLTDSIKTYAVADFPSLAAAARHYMDGTSVEATFGVFAVAGRVDGDEARMTNHAWVISARRVRDALGLDALYLVNDFVAQAASIRLLQAADIVALGAPPWRPLATPATYAILGPGTGLGMGGLMVRGGRHYPLATEGGHASFAPGTPEEIEILGRLSADYGRVSNERLVSGGGLVNIHRALSAIAGLDPGPMQPADITARAAGGDHRCMRTVDIFCAVFGAVAGDLVLTLGAWDGVFLSGGMVPRMLPALQHSGFRQRFEGKGRYAPAMASVATLAVVHPQPGLLGAAALASDRAFLEER